MGENYLTPSDLMDEEPRCPVCTAPMQLKEMIEADGAEVWCCVLCHEDHWIEIWLGVVGRHLDG